MSRRFVVRATMALAALLSLTAAQPGRPPADAIWIHPDVARFRLREIAVLPTFTYGGHEPQVKAAVEDRWLVQYFKSGHFWLPADFCRERLASASRKRDSLYAALEKQVLRSGRVDSTTAPSMARLLRTRAILSIRIDRWERLGGDPLVELKAALVDSSGSLLWRASGRSSLRRGRQVEEALRAAGGALRPGELGLPGGFEMYNLPPDFEAALVNLLSRWATKFPAATPRTAASR